MSVGDPPGCFDVRWKSGLIELPNIDSLYCNGLSFLSRGTLDVFHFQYHGSRTKYLQSDRPHPGTLIQD